jgi:hypothetical protein
MNTLPPYPASTARSVVAIPSVPISSKTLGEQADSATSNPLQLWRGTKSLMWGMCFLSRGRNIDSSYKGAG